MEPVNNLIAPQRSKLVTTTAWIFIIIGAFSTLASAIQILMYVRILSMPTMHQTMHEGVKHLPALLQLLFENFRLYLTFIFTLSLSTLVSAIGLLRRYNPARKLFITVLIVITLCLLAAFITQLSINPATTNIPSAQVPKEAKAMLRAMKGFLFIITFSTSCLFGWLIAHLTNEEIRQEFTEK